MVVLQVKQQTKNDWCKMNHGFIGLLVNKLLFGKCQQCNHVKHKEKCAQAVGYYHNNTCYCGATRKEKNELGSILKNWVLPEKLKW